MAFFPPVKAAIVATAMAITIAVSTPKGGVGKTTATVNLGAGLALKKNRVLIVDVDQQADATEHFGISNPEVTVDQVMRGEIGAGEATYETDVNGLFVMPASPALAEYEAQLSSQIAGRESKLRKALAPLDSAVEFILIDCPPAIDLMTVNALTAADYCIVVAEGEYFSVGSTNRIQQLIGVVREETNPKLEVLGVLLNKFNPQLIISREVKEKFDEAFPGLLFKTEIRKNVRLVEAPSQGVPIQSYDKHCHGTKDFTELTKEVLQRCRQNAKT